MPADLMQVMWCSGMSSTFFPTSHPQCCSHHLHLTLIQGLPLPTFLLDNTHNFNWPLVKTALRHGRKSRVPLLFGQCPNRGGNFWNGSSLKAEDFLQCQILLVRKKIELVKQANFPSWKLVLTSLSGRLTDNILGSQHFCWSDCLSKIKVFVRDVTSRDKWARLTKSVTRFGNSSRASCEGCRYRRYRRYHHCHFYEDEFVKRLNIFILI